MQSPQVGENNIIGIAGEPWLIYLFNNTVMISAVFRFIPGAIQGYEIFENCLWTPYTNGWSWRKGDSGEISRYESRVKALEHWNRLSSSFDFDNVVENIPEETSPEKPTKGRELTCRELFNALQMGKAKVIDTIAHNPNGHSELVACHGCLWKICSHDGGIFAQREFRRSGQVFYQGWWEETVTVHLTGSRVDYVSGVREKLPLHLYHKGTSGVIMEDIELTEKEKEEAINIAFEIREYPIDTINIDRITMEPHK